MLAEGLVDRFAIFVAPLVLGRGADLVALPAAAGVGAGLALRDAVWTTSGPDVLCEARVARVADAVPHMASTGPGAAEASTGRRRRGGLMFTGIIEEVGTLRRLVENERGAVPRDRGARRAAGHAGGRFDRDERPPA